MAVQIINLNPAVGVLSTDFLAIQRTGQDAEKATVAQIVALASPGVPSGTTLTTNQGIQGGGLLTSGLTISLNVSSITTATEMAAADSFPINKVSDGNLTRLVTFPNAMKALTGLPVLAFPDATDDYMIINRASDGGSYKINTSSLSLVTANMPAGGLTGQILTKNSDADYDTTWTTGGFLDQSANVVFSGPTSGGAAAPAFRALVGADLPNPGASSKGGVQSYAAVSNQFLTEISTSGVVSSAQPSASDLSNGVTGSGAVVLATSPALTTPNLGTPSAVTLTNGTGLPVSTGISGLAAGIATFLATPSSANLATAVTDETGSGLLVFATSPVLTTPNLGTPSAAVLTNATGLPLSTGVTGTLPVANGGTGVTSFGTGVATALGQNVTGSGGIVLATSPTLVTPALGTPSSGTLTSCTGLPISTGVSGLGTGVATFLATPSSANLAAAVTNETGSGSLVFATSPTLVTPVLGTPTSGTLTNCTGLPLTTGVTGTLAVGNGGTGAASFNANGVLYGNSTSPVQVTSTGSTGQILAGNTALPPSFQTLTTLIDTLGSAQGDILYRNASTWAVLAPGVDGQVLATHGAAANPEWIDVAGTGTVTSINVSGGTTGLTFSGGPITTAGTITMAGSLAVASGGTNLASYTQGDILYASGTTTLAKLAKDTNATRYLSNTGSSNDPAWDQVELTNGVSGTLPVTNGGMGAATFTANGVLYGNTTSAIQVTAQGAANSVLTANAGAPSFSASPTIGTSVTTPLVIGGTAVSSTLTLQSTSGVGSSDSIVGLVGNNGATTAFVANTSGYFIAPVRVAIGANFTPSVTLHVRTATDNNFEISNTAGGVSFQALNDARNAYRIVNFDASTTTFKSSGSDRLIVQSATVEASVPILLKTYTVGTLPSGAAGYMAYATNLRVSGQGAGLGTGGITSHNGTNWQVAGTSTTAAA